MFKKIAAFIFLFSLFPNGAVAADKCVFDVQDNSSFVSDRGTKWAKEFYDGLDEIDNDLYESGDYKEYLNFLEEMYVERNPAAISTIGHLSYYKCHGLDKIYLNPLEDLTSSLSSGEYGSIFTLINIATNTRDLDLYSDTVSIGERSSNKLIRSQAYSSRSSGIINGLFPELGTKKQACSHAKKSIKFDPSNLIGHSLVGYCYGNLYKRKNFSKAYYHMMISGADKEKDLEPIITKYRNKLPDSKLVKIEKKISNWKKKNAHKN